MERWNQICPWMNLYLDVLWFTTFSDLCAPAELWNWGHANPSRSRAVVFPPQTLYGVVKPDTPSNNEDKHWEVKGKYLVCRQMVGENQHHDVPKVRCEMIQLHWKIEIKDYQLKIMKKDKYFSIIFYKFVSNDGCISTAFWIHVTYYSSTVELIWFFVISGFFLKFLIWCLAKFLAFSFSHSSTCLAFAIGVGGCCYYIYTF